LLQSLAKRLIAATRASDTVSRQGGDEFLILLSELENHEDAALCAGKIIKVLAAPHRIGEHDLHVTVSIGIAIYPADGRNGEALIGCADTALHDAKGHGGNTYRSFRQQMKGRPIKRQSAEESLLRALERDEFRLHYQPKIHLATNVIAGVEALIRWDHPKRGLIPPSEYISLAEASGLIMPIGRWVLRAACQQAADWEAAGLAFGTMAVNVSAIEFRSRNFLDGIINLLTEAGLNPGTLELELTESVLMQDAEGAAATLRALNSQGVRVALDDFGTGFSSLNYLQRFRINTLKIDHSFVQELSSDRPSTTIIAAIIGLGRSLGQRVIAEGIETSNQLSVLRELGCDEGQGMYFCQPLPADDFVKYVRSSHRVQPPGSGTFVDLRFPAVAFTR